MRHWYWTEITRLEIREREQENYVGIFRLSTTWQFDIRLYIGNEQIFKANQLFEDIEHISELVIEQTRLEPIWI